MTSKLQNVLLGGCLALGLASAAPVNAEELRIGYISPVTGIFAQVGKDMVDGFQLYLDEHGGKLGGMDVKFIVEDDQGKPDAGVTKARKLILQDKVHMFIGGLLPRISAATSMVRPIILPVPRASAASARHPASAPPDPGAGMRARSAGARAGCAARSPAGSGTAR